MYAYIYVYVYICIWTIKASKGQNLSHQEFTNCDSDAEDQVELCCGFRVLSAWGGGGWGPKGGCKITPQQGHQYSRPLRALKGSSIPNRRPLWGFLKIRVFFGSPYSKDHSILH